MSFDANNQNPLSIKNTPALQFTSKIGKQAPPKVINPSSKSDEFIAFKSGINGGVEGVNLSVNDVFNTPVNKLFEFFSSKFSTKNKSSLVALKTQPTRTDSSEDSNAESVEETKPKIPAKKAITKPPVPASKKSFISQVRGVANKNEDSSSENMNCGPTCLAMIASHFGKTSVNPDNADQKIEEMRTFMGAPLQEEGDAAATDTDQLVKGARALGLEAREYEENANIDSLKQELLSGSKVIVALNPSTYGGPDLSHFVVVDSIEGDKVTLLDPLKQEPITITTKQLEESMSKINNFMVAIGEKKSVVA